MAGVQTRGIPDNRKDGLLAPGAAAGITAAVAVVAVVVPLVAVVVAAVRKNKKNQVDPRKRPPQLGGRQPNPALAMGGSGPNGLNLARVPRPIMR
jgi:hypothetical protein